MNSVQAPPKQASNAAALLTAEFKQRIQSVVAQMDANSVAIIVGASEQTRSNDTTFNFRQTSDVLYLNGFPEPDAVLVLTKSAEGASKLLMFVRPKDRERETWTGFREGPEGAKAKYLADEAYPIETFSSEIAKVVKTAQTVYYSFRRNREIDEKMRPILESRPASVSLKDPDAILHLLRMCKSELEVGFIREAGKISARAHVEAMKRCAREGASLKEYQLQATLEFVFRDSGAADVAYGSIVAGGNNANVLHYVTNKEQLKDGDLVLIDAACEHRAGYASDITRTFPVSGVFSPAQKEIYEVVLEAQLAAIKVCRAGSTMAKVDAEARLHLRKGLIKLGILSADLDTPEAEKAAVEKAKAEGKELLTLNKLYMHGTSHFMGLDVHDVYDVNAPERNSRQIELKPGMIFTVEPGLYLLANDERLPEKYRGIGIRIEDDVLITEGDCEILTGDAPKSVAAIESLMAEAKQSNAKA